MHAFVYVDNWRSVGKDIVEGGVYVISNFYTREAKGTMKPTSSKYLINFSNSTTVQKLIGDDFMIPIHKFEFVDLGELFNIASEYENPDNYFVHSILHTLFINFKSILFLLKYFVDIIGVMEEFEPVTLIDTMFGKRDIVKFRITDGRFVLHLKLTSRYMSASIGYDYHVEYFFNLLKMVCTNIRYSHKVSVWGQLAVATNKSYEKVKHDDIVIAIVTSAKLKIYKSKK